MKAGIAHVLLEVRQDLIGDTAGVHNWVDRLTPLFSALNDEPDIHKYQVYQSRTGPYET
jgi:predicted N-formylglutamate amidohydrolase